MEDRVEEVQDKLSGFEIGRLIEMLLIERDGIDESDVDGLCSWVERFELLIDSASDKMVAYRTVLAIAKSRQDRFASERDRYVRRFRAQGSIIKTVKGLALGLMTSTGESKIELEDGTSVILVEKKVLEFYNSVTGEMELDRELMDDAHLCLHVDIDALRASAKAGAEIEGVGYRDVARAHLRWL